MSQDQGASAKADRAATPSEPSQSSVVSGVAGIPCAFTPGPWLVSAVRRTMDGQKWLRILSEHDEQELAYVPFGDRNQKEYRQCTADARLVAAAPELYRALAQARQVLATYQPDSAPTFYMEGIWAAEEALTKARGQ